MIVNLAQLLEDRAERHPAKMVGTPQLKRPLGEVVHLARRVASTLTGTGLQPGSCAMLIGYNSLSYIVTWMAAQFAGIQIALVNPTYPAKLLRAMAADLQPDALVWTGRASEPNICPDIPWFDASELAEGKLIRSGQITGLETLPASSLPGRQAQPGDIASYMHTSGTSGVPKFCAQSHEYFIRLGRFIADGMCLSPSDTVFVPLPLFHINPLGYGIVGGLTAGCDVVAWESFSATRFWPTVKALGATVLILHGPPVEILKRRFRPGECDGHSVRIVFAADPAFLRTFDVAQGVSAYGSTEACGLSHMWTWRPDDEPWIVEGASHYAGRSRYDIEWTVTADGEIVVRDIAGRALFSGYRHCGVVQQALDDDGWFHTGDLGRIDEWGNLIFMERLSESVRVKGEYVPISFVEEQLRVIPDLGEFALWRQTDPVAGHELVLYVTGGVPAEKIKEVSATLPAFMRPSKALLVDAIPRDTGVGKVRRRLLDEVPTREVVDLQ